MPEQWPGTAGAAGGEPFRDQNDLFLYPLRAVFTLRQSRNGSKRPIQHGNAANTRMQQH